MFSCVADRGHCVEHSYGAEANDADQNDLAHGFRNHGLERDSARKKAWVDVGGKCWLRERDGRRKRRWGRERGGGKNKEIKADEQEQKRVPSSCQKQLLRDTGKCSAK